MKKTDVEGEALAVAFTTLFFISSHCFSLHPPLKSNSAFFYKQFAEDEVSFWHARVGHKPFSILKLVLLEVLGQ